MQIEHKTEKGTLYFVGIPKEATEPSLKSPNGTMPYFSIDYKLADGWRGGFALFYKEFGGKKKYPNKLELIGLTSEVTEEQAKMMVLGRIDQTSFPTSMEYYNYLSERMVHLSFDFEYALDSFKSLMQNLQVYEKHPIGDNAIALENSGEAVDWFFKMDKRTGKWLILFKTND